ncbi:hypothetical protein R0131_18340 [Clostridium sp. AL.422]|uniref:hypothetical protein n=1 Tax=Clostridium TaxID=1485 RepID=UPI00293DFBA0|nr:MULTISPECIES: hypothetical protein [unclassified Clostridium]MDV4152789.1 hypothetical protein [Clostridium sp. AL.422]
MGNVINLEIEKDRRAYLDFMDYWNSMDKSEYKLSYLDTFFLNMALLEETERVIIATVDGEMTQDDLCDHSVNTSSAMFCCYYSFFESYLTKKDSLALLSQHDFMGILDCIYSRSTYLTLIEALYSSFKDFKFTFGGVTYTADLAMLEHLKYCIAKVETLYYSTLINKLKVKLTDKDCINKQKIRNIIEESKKVLLRSSSTESEYLIKTEALNIFESLENPLEFRELCRNIVVLKIKKVKDMIGKHKHLISVCPPMLYAEEIEDYYYNDVKKKENSQNK